MDIRVLRYFLAVASEENITKAAQSLHIAQPSLSKQIMELENELGRKLLVRGKKKVMLTQEGHLLRKRAEELVALMEKTERELASDDEELSGELYIGGNATASVLEVAAQLRKEHENVKFHFYSGDAADVLERLDHGNLDFAIMLEPVDTVKYDFISLSGGSEWGLLMESGCELAGERAVCREELVRASADTAPENWFAGGDCTLGADEPRANEHRGDLQCRPRKPDSLCGERARIFSHDEGPACAEARR